MGDPSAESLMKSEFKALALELKKGIEMLAQMELVHQVSWGDFVIGATAWYRDMEAIQQQLASKFLTGLSIFINNELRRLEVFGDVEVSVDYVSGKWEAYYEDKAVTYALNAYFKDSMNTVMLSAGKGSMQVREVASGLAVGPRGSDSVFLLSDLHSITLATPPPPYPSVASHWPRHRLLTDRSPLAASRCAAGGGRLAAVVQRAPGRHVPTYDRYATQRGSGRRGRRDRTNGELPERALHQAVVPHRLYHCKAHPEPGASPHPDPDPRPEPRPEP